MNKLTRYYLVKTEDWRAHLKDGDAMLSAVEAHGIDLDLLQPGGVGYHIVFMPNGRGHAPQSWIKLKHVLHPEPLDKEHMDIIVGSALGKKCGIKQGHRCFDAVMLIAENHAQQFEP